MYERHIPPGLPGYPALHVDHDNAQAVIKMRVPNWESFVRGRWFAGVFALGYVPVAFLAVTVVVPPMESPAAWWLTVAVATLVTSVIGVRVLRRSLPEPLARFVFARRLLVYISADVIAFRSWYYDDGIRLDRYPGGDSLAIRPTVADDPEAAEFKADLPPVKPDAPHRSQHHLDTANQLQWVIRGSASDPIDPARDHQGSVRTIPVASMNQATAENFVAVINAALELTTRAPRSVSREAVGLDLDVVARDRGGAA